MDNVIYTPRRIRVAMIVIGFPNISQPSRGIFNLRAAQQLKRYVDISVIFLRTWIPGRKLLKVSYIDEIPVITVAVPQLLKFNNLNLVIYCDIAWKRLHGILKDFDLVHSISAEFAGVLSSNWTRKAGIKHITQIIGSDLNYGFEKIRKNHLVRDWEKHLHGVACNCNSLKRKFIDLYPEAINVHTIYRGVDLNVFNPAGPSIGPLVDKKPTRYLYVGGLKKTHNLPDGTNVKGGDFLMSVWREIESDKRFAQASLQFSGLDADSIRVHNWRRQLRHPERVFITGSIMPEQMPANMRAADVILIPSMNEGLPNVAVEASACGRSVIGSDVGGMAEVVVHGDNGLLLPPGDINAWRNALIENTVEPEKSEQMGENGRIRAEKLFDQYQYASKMLELYKVVLQESGHVKH